MALWCPARYIREMPILIRGLTLRIGEPEASLPERAARRLKVRCEDVRVWAVVRRALDARRHDELQFVYSVELALTGSAKRERNVVKRLGRNDVTLLGPEETVDVQPGTVPLPERPIIVGFGPAGMFAGLMLASFGHNPLILERGCDVIARHRHVLRDFYRRRSFNAESNLLYGEGGAGTYSDGKLTTRLNDPRIRLILETFYQHGADPDILIEGKPHIGSDKLPGICRRIRERIEALGGEVRFGARLDDVVVRDGVVSALVVDGETIPCGPLLLGVGQSARDTLRMLAGRGVAFETKPFQLGVRIEHPQEMVDGWQYGAPCGRVHLPPADYQFVAKGAGGAHGDVFSFCMCPGGQILPSNESPGLIATNGASRARRDSPFANSGLVVTLDPVAVCPEARSDPLATLTFLERLERTAYRLTGESYRVPAQRADDFLAGRLSDGQLATSYPLGGQWTDLRNIIPPFLADAIARGLAQLERRRPGFAGSDAVITAPETRASGPVRMTRDATSRQSVAVRNLYPVGEGAGYAGGIISAAVDGLKTAEKIIRRYAPF